jgi:hypothetical protein
MEVFQSNVESVTMPMPEQPVDAPQTKAISSPWRTYLLHLLCPSQNSPPSPQTRDNPPRTRTVVSPRPSSFPRMFPPPAKIIKNTDSKGAAHWHLAKHQDQSLTKAHHVRNQAAGCAWPCSSVSSLTNPSKKRCEQLNLTFLTTILITRVDQCHPPSHRKRKSQNKNKHRQRDQHNVRPDLRAPSAQEPQAHSLQHSLNLRGICA